MARISRGRWSSGYAVGVLVGLVVTSGALAQGTPDHLEPIRPYDAFLGGYHEYVFSQLIGEGRSELWMLVFPSFSGEHALVLREAESTDSTGRPFELEFALCEESLWYLGVRDGFPWHPPRTCHVERQAAQITKSTAERLRAAWLAVTKGTRYPPECGSGLDGVTYQFFAWPIYYGQVWSPESGTTRGLTDLGNLLGEYVKAPEKNRESILNRALKLADDMLLKMDALK